MENNDTNQATEAPETPEPEKATNAEAAPAGDAAAGTAAVGTAAVGTASADKAKQLNVTSRTDLSDHEKEDEDNDKEPVRKTFIRVLASILIIVVSVFLLLLIVSRAAQYESIPAMLQDMSADLGLMVQRVLGRE